MTVISSIVLQIGRKQEDTSEYVSLERKSQNGDELAHSFPEVKKSARIHLGNSKSNRMKCHDGPFAKPFPQERLDRNGWGHTPLVQASAVKLKEN